jgi:hypothetical protein
MVPKHKSMVQAVEETNEANNGEDEHSMFVGTDDVKASMLDLKVTTNARCICVRTHVP